MDESQTSSETPLSVDVDRAFRDAIRLPERLTPSQWSERHRVLAPSVSAEPGPWRNERTPYLTGIMDAVVEPGVEEVVFVKPTQVGGSEMIRNLLGYWIDEDPGPCLFVMPSEQAARETVEERIKPLLTTSPSLARHVGSSPSDNTMSVIRLDSMPLFFGWAGSPQALASRPCRYVCFDEVDKYPPFAGREADPISLGTERTATYKHRRRVIKTSTPTTRTGNIWRAWEGCSDQRYFWVPCPHCGKFQRLIFGQIKWPKSEDDNLRQADRIEQDRLAWYECEACKARVYDSHKPKMLQRGRWCSTSQTVNADGTIDGERHRSKRVGFHLSALYSPWRTFSEAAAQFVRTKGDVAALMNFRNSWLAEPFEQQISTPKQSIVRDKAKFSGPRGIVPDWNIALIATADTQKDHFYWVVRAWGPELRSQCVSYGIASTFEELRKATIGSVDFRSASGSPCQPVVLLIDSGGTKTDAGTSRTDEVYQFSASDPGRIIPTKGASHAMRTPFVSSRIGSAGVVLRLIDTGHYKDMLHRLLVLDQDPRKWLPVRECDDDYCVQMASEHKIMEPRTRRLVWVPISSGARNHYWDCETLQCAGADMAGVSVMTRQDTQAETRPEIQKQDNPLTAHKGRW